MKKIALFLTAALLVVGVVLCAGCTASADPIVGQWSLDLGMLGAGTYTFYENGTGFSSMSSFGMPATTSEFSWTKKGDSYLITNPDGDTGTASLSNNGKTLSITTAGSPLSINLTKVQS